MLKASEIIDTLLKTLQLNAKSFSDRIGLERPQAIYDIQKGKTKNISSSMANKIISVYPQFNMSWLLTGEGSMLKEEPKATLSLSAEELWELVKSQQRTIENLTK